MRTRCHQEVKAAGKNKIRKKSWKQFFGKMFKKKILTSE